MIFNAYFGSKFEAKSLLLKETEKIWKRQEVAKRNLTKL